MDLPRARPDSAETADRVAPRATDFPGNGTDLPENGTVFRSYGTQETGATERSCAAYDSTFTRSPILGDFLRGGRGDPERHPDIAARYPADYKRSPDPPPRIDGPHTPPERWADDINPGKLDPGRNYNCGECARAVDSTWHGSPAVAAAVDFPRVLGEDLSRMTEWAGVAPVAASMAGIKHRLDELGPGSSAVVGCDWKDEDDGHWFNAVNDAGTIKAVDGQSGMVEPWPPSIEGLGFNESWMKYSDVIFFTPDGKVERNDHP